MQYSPLLPNILKNFKNIAIHKQDWGSPKFEQDELAKLFPETFGQPLIKFDSNGKENCQNRPLKVGVVFSGGQAPGGHNVITGLHDALKKIHPDSQLFGFYNGPSGILKNQFCEITEQLLAPYRNQGGFDLLGSGRTKLETPEQFKASELALKNLDGLVIIGGDDSNTNAALLAEYLKSQGSKTCVVGVPKTIDGDLKNEYIEISFGFDSASKTYSETIGNILRDAISAKKYYHFIKLMGRSASHVTLECALQTRPNLALISEEVEALELTLSDVTKNITDLICDRSEKGKDYGVILIPEGIVEFISDFKQLIKELNTVQLEGTSQTSEGIEEISKKLTQSSRVCLKSIPIEIQLQLLMDRDPHGNVQVSKIETERMFIETVNHELNERMKAGLYKGKFSPQPHFCGYEGRACMPSNFDCQYCYSLGHVAALLINSGASGYMCCVKNLFQPVEDWQIGGIPLIGMMHLEQRHGKNKPVIRKALVDLEGSVFAAFKEIREKFRFNDYYNYPGPMQFFGPAAICEETTLTLEYETSTRIANSETTADRG